MSTRSVAIVALLAALVAALGFLLAGVPNVELASLAAFSSGTAVGARRGAAAGAIGMGLYSSLNPYGAAPPPTWVAQVAAFALIGATGGALAGRPDDGTLASWRGSVLLAGIGLVLTVVFDTLTNWGTAVAVGAGRDPWPFLVAGWAFGLWHVVWNVAFFAILGPPIVRMLRRWRTARS